MSQQASSRRQAQSVGRTVDAESILGIIVVMLCRVRSAVQQHNKQWLHTSRPSQCRQSTYLLTSKNSRAPPVPSLCADVPVRMSDSSGLKQHAVSEWVVGRPEKACTGVFSLRRSHNYTEDTAVSSSRCEEGNGHAMEVLMLQQQNVPAALLRAHDAQPREV